MASLRILFTCLLCWVLTSCGNLKEGCLDVNAINFDVSADENCCCLYPTMGVAFDYYNGDQLLSNVPLIDASGDTVIIDKLTFIASDISWKTDGQAIRSDSRTWLFLTPGNYHDSIRSIDDYYLVRNSGAQFDNFTFKEPIYIQSLSLMVGVADSAITNQPFYIKNANHTLAGTIDSMYNYSEKQYRTLRLAYRMKNQPNIADTIYIDAPQFRKKFELPINYQTVLGFKNFIQIRIQVDMLIKDIHFVSDDPKVIAQKIVANLENIILH